MPNGRFLLGSFWTSFIFALIFLALGVSIGYDLKSSPGKVESRVTTGPPSREKVNPPPVVSTLPDSLPVKHTKNTQLQSLAPKLFSENLILQPTLVPAGQSVSMLNGKLLLSVSSHPYNDSTEAEVIIRRIKNPLERAMQYGEVVRLFYAYTGRQESFQFEGNTYLIHFLQVGKLSQKLGVKFALYAK